MQPQDDADQSDTCSRKSPASPPVLPASRWLRGEDQCFRASCLPRAVDGKMAVASAARHSAKRRRTYRSCTLATRPVPEGRPLALLSSSSGRERASAQGRTAAASHHIDHRVWCARATSGLTFIKCLLIAYFGIFPAEREWQDLLAKQSTTLSECDNEYRRRYGRTPPKGLDKWWAFAQKHNVVLVDEYDRISKDIQPFLGLSPEVFAEKNLRLATDPESHTFTLNITGGVLYMAGKLKSSARASQMAGLLEPIIQDLPDML